MIRTGYIQKQSYSNESYVSLVRWPSRCVWDSFHASHTEIPQTTRKAQTLGERIIWSFRSSHTAVLNDWIYSKMLSQKLQISPERSTQALLRLLDNDACIREFHWDGRLCWMSYQRKCFQKRLIKHIPRYASGALANWLESRRNQKYHQTQGTSECYCECHMAKTWHTRALIQALWHR